MLPPLEMWSFCGMLECHLSLRHEQIFLLLSLFIEQVEDWSKVTKSSRSQLLQHC